MNLNKSSQQNKLLLRKSSLARKKYTRPGGDLQEQKDNKNENQFRITNKKINITQKQQQPDQQKKNSILQQQQQQNNVEINQQNIDQLGRQHLMFHRQNSVLDREKREEEEKKEQERKLQERIQREKEEEEQKRKIQQELQQRLEIQKRMKEQKEKELQQALEEQKREQERKIQLQKEKEEAERKLKEAEERKKQLERQQRLEKIIRDRKEREKRMQEEQSSWQQNLLDQRREERKQNENEEINNNQEDREEEEEQKSNYNSGVHRINHQQERLRNRQQVLQQQQRTLENIERLNRERDEIISQQLNRNQDLNQLHRNIFNSRNQQNDQNNIEENVYSRGRSTNPIRQPARVQVRMTSTENRNNQTNQQAQEEEQKSERENRNQSQDSSQNQENEETDQQRRERLQDDPTFQIRLRQLMVQGLRNVLEMSSQLGVGNLDSQPLRRELEQLSNNPFREPDRLSDTQVIRVERRNGDDNRPTFGIYLSRNPQTNFRNVAQALTDIQRMILQIRVLGQFADRPQGLSERQINLIPEVKYKQTEQDTTCSICLEEQQNGDLCKVLTCLHKFHPSCINDWLKAKSTCPNCKADQKQFFEGEESDKEINHQ